MQNAIWLLCILVTLVLFIARPKLGGIAYIVATMLAPYGIFANGDLPMRADYILAPTMLALQLLGAVRTARKLSLLPTLWLFVTWLLWMAMSTLLSSDERHLVSAYGCIRLVLVMIVFSWIPWRERDSLDFSFWYVIVAIPIAVLSVGQVLDAPYARSITEAAYAPPETSVIERQAEAERLGYLYRAVGVFGNVSPNGTYFLLVSCLAVSLLISPLRPSKRRLMYPVLGAAIIGGISTASATFVGGIVLSLFVAIATSNSQRRRKLILLSIGCLAALGACVLLVSAKFGLVGDVLSHQWQRLGSSDILGDRYSSYDGILAEAISVFWERPFVGHGWTFQDVFTSDSIYFSILFCAGFFGSVPFVVGLWRLSVMAYRNPVWGRWALNWTAIMLLGGVGCTSLLTGRLADSWWAVQGLLIGHVAAMGETRSRIRKSSSAGVCRPHVPISRRLSSSPR